MNESQQQHCSNLVSKAKEKASEQLAKSTALAALLRENVQYKFCKSKVCMQHSLTKQIHPVICQECLNEDDEIIKCKEVIFGLEAQLPSPKQSLSELKSMTDVSKEKEIEQNSEQFRISISYFLHQSDHQSTHHHPTFQETQSYP